jgi:putative ABC transport system permease protein
VVGITVVVVGALVLVKGLAGSGLLWVGLGALVMFLGVFTLGPAIARPAMRLLGAPLPAAGMSGLLARENAARNPKRTARTGGALMIGVALVTAITIIAATARDWVRDVYNKQFSGDFVVATNTYGFGGISTQLASQLNALPEVEFATGVRAGAAHYDFSNGNGDLTYVSIDPATVGKLFDIGVIQGNIEALDVNGIMVDDNKAADLGLHVGSTMRLGFLDGSWHKVTVEGIYTEDQLATGFVISHALHEQSGADQFDFSVFIGTAPGVSENQARAAITSLADAYPNADVQSRSEYLAAQTGQIDQLLNLMYGLLALAVVIALFSIANSIALSIHERTRELGLLRAVGMTRGQTRMSVRLESVLVALLGTTLGLVVGVFFGWSISVTLRDEGLTAFNMPVMSLLVIVVLALAGGIIAALRPSRRAAKLDVLAAIASE